MRREDKRLNWIERRTAGKGDLKKEGRSNVQ